MSINIKNKEDKVYIVLGTPHSATSYISKLLNDAGVKMHPDSKEFYEDSDFVKLNQKIFKNKNNYDFSDKIKSLIKKRASKMWGWKDPKTAFTLDKYLPHLEGDVFLICCFRKPKKVLESWIRSRKTSEGRELLDKYNNALLAAAFKAGSIEFRHFLLKTFNMAKYLQTFFVEIFCPGKSIYLH